MKNKDYSILAVMLLCTHLVFAQSKALNTKSLIIKFKIKNAGISVNGNFKTGKATVMFDEKNPINSKFTGVVVAKSIFTDNNTRDKHLREKKEFFNAEKFPEIKMESVKIIPSGASYNVQWNLTMKGITKSFTTPLSYVKKDGIYNFSTAFKINRRDWQVGEKSFIMSDNLDIDITVAAN
jgi:polyisoprenoid-binding protein YceI